MPTLSIFSRRHLALAALGFLLVTLALPGLALAGLSRTMHPSSMRIDPTFPVLLIAGSLLTFTIGSFFWTLGQLSIWSAQGSRLAQACLWIWICTSSALLTVNLLLGRSFNPVGAVPILLILVLWPKPGAPAWTWSLISILERQEPRPFLWGVCAAIGFLALAMTLSPASLEYSSRISPVLEGPAGLIITLLATFAMSIVLGALMQVWTKQRWPARTIATLVLIGIGTAFALKARIPVRVMLMPWTGSVWSLGLLAGDFLAAREQPALLPLEAGA